MAGLAGAGAGAAGLVVPSEPEMPAAGALVGVPEAFERPFAVSAFESLAALLRFLGQPLTVTGSSG